MVAIGNTACPLNLSATLPFCHVTLKAPRPLARAYPRHLNTLGDHLRNKRLDLELLQKDVAYRLGVDEASVYNWESRRASPSLQFIPKVIAFLCYAPKLVEANTLGEKLVVARRQLGIRQEDLARRLRVDPSTLGRWERGGAGHCQGISSNSKPSSVLLP